MWGELSWGEFSLGRVVLGRVVFGASCPDPLFFGCKFLISFAKGEVMAFGKVKFCINDICNPKFKVLKSLC